jgi:DNA-binding ferritin-like protein
VESLVDDHEHVIRLLRSFVLSSQEEGGADIGTVDFFTQLLREHEEMSWTLRSFLLGEPVQPTEPFEEAHGPELA